MGNAINAMRQWMMFAAERWSGRNTAILVEEFSI
jgi:hypothetical protein